MPSLGVRATKIPPERPRPTRIRCAADSSRSASRMVGRLTPNSSASSCSVPIRSPALSCCSSSQTANLGCDLLAGAGCVVQDLAAGPWAYRRHAGQGYGIAKVQTFCSISTSREPASTPCATRRSTSCGARADDDLLQPRLDRGAVPRRAARGPRFVLGLHEGSVVGMAAGDAIARGEPSLALLHSTPGLGNAVGAIATARANRAPVVVSSASRTAATSRSSRSSPGAWRAWRRLPGLGRPARARAGRPGRIVARLPRSRDRPRPGDRDRAHGRLGRARPGGARDARARAAAALRGRRPGRGRRARRAARRRRAPALVVGAGADGDERWAALVALAERLGAPSGRSRSAARPASRRTIRVRRPAPARPRAVREALAPHDLVLVVGAGVFRQYAYEPGPLVDPARGSRSSPTTRPRPTAAPPTSRSSASPRRSCARSRRRSTARPRPPPRRARRAARSARPGRAAARRARARGAGRAAAARHDPPRGGAVEPARAPRAPPRHRPARVHQRDGEARLRGPRRDRRADGAPGPPGGGGRRRRLLALPGPGAVDGGPLRRGVLFVVLANGRYAIMDRLAERHGGAARGRRSTTSTSPRSRARWAARRRVATHDELLGARRVLPASPSARRRSCSRSSSSRTRPSIPRADSEVRVHRLEHRVGAQARRRTAWLTPAPDPGRPRDRTATRARRCQSSRSAPARPPQRSSGSARASPPWRRRRPRGSGRRAGAPRVRLQPLANTTFCWLPPDRDPAD